MNQITNSAKISTPSTKTTTTTTTVTTTTTTTTATGITTPIPTFHSPYSNLKLSQYHSKRLSTSVNVTHFDFVSLVDQNNLSDDSCLIVVDYKVYDLTLWLQHHLSCNQSDSIPRNTRLTYSDHSSSHPSPPPSPVVLSSSQTQPTQPNQFDRVLALSKTDPVRAGDLLRSIYDQGPGGSDRTRLEDWIQDYRIGDFTPTQPVASALSSLYPHQITPASHQYPFNHSASTNSLSNPSLQSSSTRIHSQLTQSDLDQSPSTSPSTTTSFASSLSILPSPSTSYKQTDSSTKSRFNQYGREGNLSLSGVSSISSSNHKIVQGSSSPSLSHPPTSRPSHLHHAMALVDRLKKQVADAQRGVGIANLSLSEAWDQLAKAEMVQNQLILQASEGFRPIWHEWDDELQ